MGSLLRRCLHCHITPFSNSLLVAHGSHQTVRLCYNGFKMIPTSLCFKMNCSIKNEVNIVTCYGKQTYHSNFCLYIYITKLLIESAFFKCHLCLPWEFDEI